MNRELDDETIDRLLTDSEPWLSCDDCFEQADGAIEGAVAENVALDRRFGVHLVACPVCLDEARALAELIALDLGLPPADALRRLDEMVAATRR